MAEYQQTSVSAGEMAQRFIEFVMMQAQNAAFMLGQIPHPQTGEREVNLDMARLLIDQLIMIQEKTKGNLNGDETRILGSALSNLQMAFVETAQAQRSGGHVPSAPSRNPTVEPEEVQPEVKSAPDLTSAQPSGDSESKKKFVKSYGS
ncbi:MAG: DUF1844 domain-containing protein [Verrucomicrobia bacterium]|nr:DUF1844 domain-containing protein [Verrucomicrobiota bacterium]